MLIAPAAGLAGCGVALECSCVLEGAASGSHGRW